jgi:hypothetical protein
LAPTYVRTRIEFGVKASIATTNARPRLAGAREASGRLSRRISDREKECRGRLLGGGDGGRRWAET